MDVAVPDIGDFTDVPVIEILVEVGQEVAAEDPLVTLESEKATMDVPAPEAGGGRERKGSPGGKGREGATTPGVEPGSAGGAGPPAAPGPQGPPPPRGGPHA